MEGERRGKVWYKECGGKEGSGAGNVEGGVCGSGRGGLVGVWKGREMGRLGTRSVAGRKGVEQVMWKGRVSRGVEGVEGY